MVDNEEMKERVEKAYDILGTRKPTMEEYANYLFPHLKSD